MTAGPEQIPSRFNGLKVLLVEDETLVSFLIEDMLHDLGFLETSHAATVREALAHLDAHRPNVAVLDLNLGGQSVESIVAQLDAMRVPFVFATGYGESGMPQRWAGQPVVQKPFTRDALAMALRKALDRSVTGRPARHRSARARPATGDRARARQRGNGEPFR